MIESRLQVVHHDLAESTVRALDAGALVHLVGGEAALCGLTLDYGPAAGNAALREAIGRGCGVLAEAVLTVPGTMVGLLLLADAVCRGGGEAVLVTPCFGPAAATLLRAGATIRPVALDFDDAYRLDVDRVVAACGPATRLVCLANPQNPSGRQIPDAALAALLDAIPTETLICLDETYRDGSHGDACPIPSAAGLDPRIITLGSLSKAHGAPGLRIGWLTVPDPVLRARLIAAKFDLLICGSVLDEALAAAILARPEAVLRPRQRDLAAAYAVVAKWHTIFEAGRLDLLRPDAGGLCCARLAACFDEAAIARFWAAVPAAGLRLAPGCWFGESDRVFRIGFGHVAPAALPAALGAVSAALDAAVGEHSLPAPARIAV